MNPMPEYVYVIFYKTKCTSYFLLSCHIDKYLYEIYIDRTTRSMIGDFIHQSMGPDARFTGVLVLG